MPKIAISCNNKTQLKFNIPRLEMINSFCRFTQSDYNKISNLLSFIDMSRKPEDQDQDYGV